MKEPIPTDHQITARSKVRPMLDGGKLHELIDDSPVTGLQLMVIGLCFSLNMIDGMDVLAISFAAPVLAEEWSLPAQTLGAVFSAALVGMTLGALFLAPLGDLMGRRSVIMLSISIVAAGMVATAFARSVPQLALLRFVTGLGVGALLASLATITAEYSPERRRNLAITFVQAGYPVGAVLSGLLAAYLIPEFGWRPLFIVGGAITAIALPLTALLIPESLDFLAKKQPREALSRINAILSRMGHEKMSALPENTASASNGSGVEALLSRERRQPTLLLWFAFFITFGTLYFLLTWIPRLVTSAGLTLNLAILASVVFNFGSVFGMVLLGYLSDRYGLKRIIMIWLIAAAVLMIGFGYLREPLVVLAALALIGCTMQGGFIGLYPVAARLYPTLLRTTGVGWAIGIGRTGAILAPFVGGVLIGAGVSMAGSFMVFAVPLIFAALAVVFIRAESIQ